MQKNNKNIIKKAKKYKKIRTNLLFFILFLKLLKKSTILYVSVLLTF